MLVLHGRRLTSRPARSGDAQQSTARSVACGLVLPVMTGWLVPDNSRSRNSWASP